MKRKTKIGSCGFSIRALSLNNKNSVFVRSVGHICLCTTRIGGLPTTLVRQQGRNLVTLLTRYTQAARCILVMCKSGRDWIS